MKVPPVRVITWNLGGASQALESGKQEKAWEYLMDLKPDIALVQEAMVPDRVRHSCSVIWKSAHEGKRWGTAVVSRYPVLEEIDMGTEGAELGAMFQRMQNRVIGARLDVEGSPLVAVSVHAPWWQVSTEDLSPMLVDAVKLQTSPQMWFSDIAFGAVRSVARTGLPFVVGGDWNTGRLWDGIYGPCGGVEFFERMEAHGFVDCVDRIHGEEQRTWFRKGDAPYQLDHLFCDKESAKRLRSCDADPRPADELDLSDHAPIVAEWAEEDI